MRASRILILAGLLTLGIASARADVIFQGKVEYWDRLDNSYHPAKRVHVEIEGDWWEPDIDVQTDNSGSYYKKFRNPYWGDFDDVDIEVYAETGGLLEVKEAWYSWWPYHAISPQRDNVDGGDTVTINMKIGGPQNSAAEAYYKTMAETANAFVVHQEMLAHYDRLRSVGWPSGFLDDKTVIVPSAGVTSYYNHLTENINLVYHKPGESGFTTGYVDWTNINEGNSSYLNYPRFKETCRHELSHGIHDDITGASLLMGLNMPSTHSLEGQYAESNRWIAFTEGWAAFLPAATLNQGGQLESSKPPAGLNLEGGGDHYAMEGEVAGIFWDIFDPVGSEVMDKPATKTYDNAFTLPAAVVSGQTWTDRIADPNLSKLRNIVSKGMDQIQEFLDEYRSTYPSDLHAIKTISLNRAITWGVPNETPAVLTGTPTASRSGNTVTIGYTVNEADSEDRPYVKLTAWNQRGSATPTFAGETVLSSGWSGASKSGSFNVTVPSGTGTPDLLWLVVNDEMRPTAYRLTVPAAPTIVKFPISAALLQTLVKSQAATLSRGIIVEDKPSPEEAANVKAMQDAVKAARAELRAYAERKADAYHADRLLYKIGSSQGSFKGQPLPMDLDLKAKRPAAPGQARALPNPQAEAAKQALHRWMDQVGSGMTPLGNIMPEAKRDLLPFRQRLGKHVQDQQAAGDRAAQIGMQLDSALTRAAGRSRGVSAEKTKQALDGAQQAVKELKKALQDAAGDSELTQDLQRQSMALGQAVK